MKLIKHPNVLHLFEVLYIQSLNRIYFSLIIGKNFTACLKILNAKKPTQLILIQICVFDLNQHVFCAYV